MPPSPADIHIVRQWRKDFFLFAKECLKMLPAEPVDSLRGRRMVLPGRKIEVMLFDVDGSLTYSDLSYYRKEFFKPHQRGRFTWQQTVILTAYQRAIDTFGRDAYDVSRRFITISSGHGIGKSSSMCAIALHFLITLFGSQIGVTANTEDQLKDVFLKEFFIWSKKLPPAFEKGIRQMDDFVRVGDDKDWFLRARVSRPEKPEALAGLHARYVLILVDEASAIADQIFETMKGALTGDNYIVVYVSNPTRAEGEFFESHKPGSSFTRLSFSSEDSPIVKPGYIEKMASDYGRDSDEYRIRVLGKFPSTTEMDDKGWIPLFAGVTVQYEPERGQLLKYPLLGVDPAGKGRDTTIAVLRDELYLKEVLHEETSTPRDLAGKLRTIATAYEIPVDDIGVDAFGIGAEVVANMDAGVHALLTDHPREESKLPGIGARNEGTTLRFNSWKSELGWKFMRWVKAGGIIITNNPRKWERLLEKIKYKRDAQGRIALMPKVEFKKEYGFSPDEFDAALYTFFKDHGTKPLELTRAELEQKELQEWIQRQQQGRTPTERTYSSM